MLLRRLFSSDVSNNSTITVNYRIFLAKDGSHTLTLTDFDASYHSVNGALTESQQVYIQNGFNAFSGNEIVNVLEVGFGTGLNALLMYKTAAESGMAVHYHAIEP